MALNLGNLFFSLSVDKSALGKAQADVKRLSQEVEKRRELDISVNKQKIADAKREIKSLEGEISRLESTGSSSIGLMEVNFKALGIAIAGAGFAVGAFAINIGSQMEMAEARIKTMVGSAERANIVMGQLRDIGNQTGQSVLILAENYGKMASFVENGSMTLQESIDLTKGLSDASLVLGASSDQLGYVIYGLSQAMGSGVVRAEEFNQVMEPLPALLNRVESANGLVSGSLRQMVNDGKLTSQHFKELLIPALQSFGEQSKEMADTLKVQSGRVTNSLNAIGEDIYDNINSPLSSSLKLLDSLLQRLTSTKRATTDELQSRLKDLKQQQQNIITPSNALSTARLGTFGQEASTTGNKSKIAEIEAELKARQQKIDDAEKEAQKVKIENEKRESARADMEAQKESEKKAKRAESDAKMQKAEAERIANERLQLKSEFDQMEANANADKFEKEIALENYRYSESLKKLEEFRNAKIASQAEINNFEVASEEAHTAKLLEIEKQRQDEKLALRQQFQERQAQSIIPDGERELALAELAYQKKLEDLKKYGEQEGFTQAEVNNLKLSEEMAHQERMAQLKEENDKKEKKKIDENYRATMGAKVAFAIGSKKLAKDLSSKEVQTYADGLEQTLSTFGEHSKKVFEAQKALSIARATISGIEATINAYNFGNATGGPIVGAIFAGVAAATTAAQIAGIQSASYSGGRKEGGSVSPNSMYRVAEGGKPELLSIGKETFLMTAGQGGKVTSNADMMRGGGGAVMIVIKNEVAGIEFVQNNLSSGEVEIIARRVVNAETPKLIQREFNNPNSVSSKSLSRNYEANRRR